MDTTPRKDAPTVEEVRQCRYWWRYPKNGKPEVLVLDVVGGNICLYGTVIGLYPEEWSGLWAPCLPPQAICGDAWRGHICRLPPRHEGGHVVPGKAAWGQWEKKDSGR